MLDVRNLSISYGQHRALEDASIHVEPGEIVVILGANGAGKSTLLRAISGICEGRHSGAIDMDGHAILGMTSDRIVERGIALVPEGRGIFGDLSVRENLKLGAYSMRAREDETANLDRVLSLFPKLEERQGQIARTMSGGEQQMVAIGRAMMSNPSILMLDEPSLGLSPLLCKELFGNLSEVRKSGIGILLVEQNAKQSLAIADRGYLLENAHIVHEDSAASLANDPAVQKAYLGAGGSTTPVPVKKQGGNDAADRDGSSIDEAIPTIPRLAPRIVHRHSADELIGASISDIVAKAATPARPVSIKKPSSLQSQSTSGASVPSGHGERLRSTILEIERSAANAGQDYKSRVKKRISKKPRASEKPASTPDEKPVVIEVYRAPRVEVWRRRPGSAKFDRD